MKFSWKEVWGRIFNVRSGEWSRLFVAYFLRFVYRVAFVLGWTLLVALFISTYGVEKLPYLLICNALLTVLGSFLYSNLLERYLRRDLIVGTIFALLASLSMALYVGILNDLLFFGIFIFAVSIFVMQLRILLSGYVERMFNPLESERVFPLVEGAETFGGIVGGVLLASFASSVHFSFFIYVFMAMVSLIYVFLWCDFKWHKRVKLVLMEDVKKSSCLGLFMKLKMEFSNVKQAKYLKGLIFIVFLHWFVFNLLEYQYTVAVFENTRNVVFEIAGGFEGAFIHDLGVLYILFSLSSLFVQLFIGGRILTSLGVVGTMLMHVFVTTISVFGLIASFGFGAAIFAKNNFIMTTILYITAYQASYYAINDGFRAEAREFLEGVVRPLGSLLGTFCILILQAYVGVEFLVSYVNALLFLAILLFGYVVYSQQSHYTAVALEDVKICNSRKVRINAVDILGQKGHGGAEKVLRRFLRNEKEAFALRVRILYALGERAEIVFLPDITRCLGSANTQVREAALDAIMGYRRLFDDAGSNLFLKHNLIEALRELYAVEHSDVIVMKILHLMSKISAVTAMEFLFEVLASARPANRAEAIYALGKECDAEVIEVLRPFLKSRYLKERINAAIVLIKFPKTHDECMKIVRDFLRGGGVRRRALGLYAVGELALKNYEGLCRRALNSRSEFVKMHAALALMKLGDEKAVKLVVDLLFDADKKTAERLRVLLQSADLDFSQEISRMILLKVNRRIDEILKLKKASSLRDLDADSLQRFKWFYTLVGEDDEVELINGIMKKIYA